MAASRGVLWLAFGKPFVMMAAHSARTLAAPPPDVGRFLRTNLPLESVRWQDIELFTAIRSVNAPDNENRLWKTSSHSWAPFEQNVYLDCDTEVRADITPLFEILDSWPLIARHNTTRSKRAIPLGNSDSQRLAVSEWNGGIFGFDLRRKQAAEFLQGWADEYRALGEARDQPSLLRTIYNPETIIPMPINGVWNAMNKRGEQQILFEDRPEDIRIHHYVDPSRSPEVGQALCETLGHLRVTAPIFDERMDGAIDATLARLADSDAALKQTAHDRLERLAAAARPNSVFGRFKARLKKATRSA